MGLYIDKTDLAGGNSGKEIVYGSNILSTEFYPDFKVKLAGPSFNVSGVESASMNPLDTFADIKAKLDALHTGLDVAVSAQNVEDIPTGEVFCSARRFMINWRAPLAFEGRVNASNGRRHRRCFDCGERRCNFMECHHKDD